MSNIKKEKYGFVYIWYDRKHKRYYVGCRYGNVNDGYICSSTWMMQAYKIRPEDFKRRILKTNILKENLLDEEHRYLSMIKKEELGYRYYNKCNYRFGHWTNNPEARIEVAEKVSKANKGKNTGYRDPSIGKAISDAKKGKPLTEAHKEALRAVKRKPHTEEWKLQNSIRMKERWSKIPKKEKATLSIEVRNKLRSDNLKARWSNPVWKANQIERLKIGSSNRTDRNAKFINN